jgi:hypothetical protein
MSDVRTEPLEIIQRIVAGDEGIAGVEVEPQVRGVEVAEEPLQEVAIGGVGAVSLDVDAYAVVIGPG